MMFQGSSLLLYITLICSLSLLISHFMNVPQLMSMCSFQLGAAHLLAHVLWCFYGCTSVGYISRSETAGSSGMHIPIWIDTARFPKFFSIYTLTRKAWEFWLLSLSAHQHLVLAVFLCFMLVHLEGSDTVPRRLKDSHSGSSMECGVRKGS